MHSNAPRAGHPERGGTAPVKDVLASYLRESGLGPKLRDAKVLRAWRDVLATAVAAHARAVRFADGELWVEVDSAAHFQELRSFTGEQLRRAANQRLGAERIRRVNFKLAR